MIYKYQHTKLLKLNHFIQSLDEERLEYHMKHIKLAMKYALLLNRRLGYPTNSKKLAYVALLHDILKEKSFKPDDQERKYEDLVIPSDVVKYVRLNLDILEEFDMADYFNSDAQWHPLAGGIFVYKELGIKDPEIIYPIMFHSCPIIAVYKGLDYRTRTMCDIMMLADKLSSNYLRINYKEHQVSLDLDAAVFGLGGKEFNYSLGLLLARLINTGKIEGEESKITNEYYLNRFLETNPWVKEVKIGGSKKWPKRKSLAFLT